MKAMIFAAGLGTRLKPLTDRIPKALVPIGDKPLLQRIIEKLIFSGFTEIVINVHHFPDLIRKFLYEHRNFGIRLNVSDESDALLGTGGGLFKAAGYLMGGEPILVHNVDIISDLDFSELINYHTEKKALATLVVRDRRTERYLLFDHDLRLTGWMNSSTGEVRRSIPCTEEEPLAFGGIQVIDPRLFSLITPKGKFSIIDTYLELAACYPVRGFRDHSALWMDAGKPEHLEEARRILDRDEETLRPCAPEVKQVTQRSKLNL